MVFCLKTYRTVLFDADNTLFDFSRAEKEAIADTLTYCGICPTDELIRAYSEINDRMWKRLERGEIDKLTLREARFAEFCEAFGLVADPSRMAAAYIEFLSQKTYLIDGAQELCAELSSRYRLYIVTNGILTVQKRRFSTSAIQPYFKDIFISEELGFEKPHPGYFEAVAKRVPDFLGADTLIVGDSLTSDIKGGIAAGLDTCWYNPRSLENKEKLPITFEIHALKDLAPLLLS